MLICKTPLRISFFGGGTDFPKWYKKNKGMVISSSIDKYCYLMIRNLPPFFTFNYRIRYFKSEFTKEISQIKHPSIREALKKYHTGKNGLEIVHSSDLPSQSGLGSSSAFSACLIKGIQILNGKVKKNKEIALDAIDFEQNILKEKVGSQDQYACSIGGFNIINFGKSISHKSISLENKKIKKLANLSSLFFCGFPRDAQRIEADKLKNIKKNKSQYHDLFSITKEAKNTILKKSDVNFINDISYLLNKSWEIKKSLSQSVSNDFIDNIYNHGLKNGALAGKILGAGAGGFMLFISITN